MSVLTHFVQQNSSQYLLSLQLKQNFKSDRSSVDIQEIIVQPSDTVIHFSCHLKIAPKRNTGSIFDCLMTFWWVEVTGILTSNGNSLL